MAGVQLLYGDSESTITHFASQKAGTRILEHRDSCDIGPQLITTFGHYKGGFLEIFVEKKNGPNGFEWTRGIVRPLWRAA